MQVKSYLSFEGRCEEALDFYKKAVGAEVTTVMRFRENPDFQNGAPPEGCLGPGAAEKIMHSEFRIGETVLMATDGMNSGKPSFAGTSQALLVDSAADADRFFTALSEGGQVMMPLAKTFFSEKFGMTTDRFGVPWMIVVDHP
ncbi:PhnB protein [Dongia mobilis]|uniref:PhnB protein n=1 Tax=Dongia mobilis TaxID=578943 RepID=A0A4R6WV61_9PROT|nr:VOC family protein [Dongia mobilis]TDQ84060.1 PhnB protein [Dongia mobilis]